MKSPGFSRGEPLTVLLAYGVAAPADVAFVDRAGGAVGVPQVAAAAAGESVAHSGCGVFGALVRLA